MSLRTTATITLSVAFAVLMATGFLLYATPYNYFVGSLHIWGAVLFLLCIALHIIHNAKAYKNHMKKRRGQWSMTFAILGIIPISSALIFGIAPVSSVIEAGHLLKKSKTTDDLKYTIIDLSTDVATPKLNVFFKAGSEYHSEPQPLFLGLTYTSVPQIVIWMETLEGKYIDTLYITGKTSD